ncbi:hypothetical protein EJB05_20511, partial [Eragrostis curvula]
MSATSAASGRSIAEFRSAKATHRIANCCLLPLPDLGHGHQVQTVASHVESMGLGIRLSRA